MPESSFYAWRRELEKRDGLIASSSWKQPVMNRGTKQPFAAVRIHLCKTPTDMRKSFDSLAALAQTVIGQDPLKFGAGDENWYRYVGNKSTIAIDPTGTKIEFVTYNPPPIGLSEKQRALHEKRVDDIKEAIEILKDLTDHRTRRSIEDMQNSERTYTFGVAAASAAITYDYFDKKNGRNNIDYAEYRKLAPYSDEKKDEKDGKYKIYQEEFILHALIERKYANDNGAVWQESHVEALKQQNEWRRQHGLVPIDKITEVRSNDGGRKNSVRIFYVDGQKRDQ